MRIKRKYKIGIFLLLLITFSGITSISASAYSQKIASGTLNLYSFDTFGEEIAFKTPDFGYVVLDMNVSTLYKTDITSKDRFRVVLTDENLWLDADGFPDFDRDTEIDNVLFKISDGNSGNFGKYWQWTDYKIPAGEYLYTISNEGKNDLKIKYTVRFYSDFSTSISLSKNSINLLTDQYKIVTYTKTPSGSRAMIAAIESSDKAIAEGYVEADGKGIGILAKKPGSCKLTVKLLNGYSTTIKVTVKNPKNAKLQYSSCELYNGDSIKNTLKYTTKKVKWSTSNKKVATVSQSGKIVAKGPGKCTITAKCAGKKYKCSVKVLNQEPNFGAILAEYNTRNNYFVVKIKNYGKKPLMIYSSGAKVEDKDYKRFDRNVRLSKNITIKPGKKATLKFYVNGGITWYNYKDFTLLYKFKYDNKTYNGKVTYTDTIYKNGKTWYNTYWRTKEAVWYGDVIR